MAATIHLFDKKFNRLEEPQQRAIVQHLAGQKGNCTMLPMLIEELQRTAGGGGQCQGQGRRRRRRR